jgi:hypothetical protein
MEMQNGRVPLSVAFRTFNTIAAIRKAMQETSGGDIGRNNGDPNPTTIRSNLKIKPNIPADAVGDEGGTMDHG